MLIFNQELITLKQQEEARRKELEKLEKRRKELEKNFNSQIELKEQQLIQQTNNLYNNKSYKFKAKLSEDFENVEIYSQGNVLVGVYTREQNGQFKPLELRIVGINKQEHLILSETTPHLYRIMENIFR